MTHGLTVFGLPVPAFFRLSAVSGSHDQLKDILGPGILNFRDKYTVTDVRPNGFTIIKADQSIWTQVCMDCEQALLSPDLDMG